METVKLLRNNEEIAVGKILCIGRNYAEHAKEMQSDIPESPVFFLKPATAIVHSGGNVVIPSISKDVYHEVEMTVLMGTGGKNISHDSALKHVAGYGVGLDMTLRDIQDEAKKKGLPWTIAKGFDTSAPISQFVPAKKVEDPTTLEIQLKVNGAVRQRASTRHLIFSIQDLIAHISQFMTFERGDIIFTGTPEGVAQVKSGDRLLAELLDPSGESLVSLAVNIQ